MKALAIACIIAAFCVAKSLQSTPHNQCANGPLPKELRVEGCDSSPCPLRRGTILKAAWDFIVPNDCESMKTKVRITIGNTTINYPFPEPNACNSLSKGECPLKKNEEATYNLEMPVSSEYPAISLNIEFSLVDENNISLVCFSVLCRVVG